MKATVLFIAIGVILVNCSPKSKYREEVPQYIVKDIMSWLQYEQDSIVWSSDYKAINTDGKEMNKFDFLTQLSTGNFFPYKTIASCTDCIQYKLGKIDTGKNIELKEVIAQKAKLQLSLLKMEGAYLPSFHFTDMHNNVYNKTTTKNKILVLNCWYISCAPCVAEIPKLNKLVEKYKNDSNIVFLALAFDKPSALSRFLQKNEFLYNIIPDKEEYLLNELQISGYPTHLIVGKDGKIVKVIAGDKWQEVAAILKKMQVASEG